MQISHVKQRALAMAQKGNALYLGNQYGKDASSVHDEEGRL
jgi:hypothetical protein